MVIGGIIIIELKLLNDNKIQETCGGAAINENILPPRATSRCTRSRARLPLTIISRMSLTIQKFLVKKLCRSATLCSIHEISILSQASRVRARA